MPHEMASDERSWERLKPRKPAALSDEELLPITLSKRIVPEIVTSSSQTTLGRRPLPGLTSVPPRAMGGPSETRLLM